MTDLFVATGQRNEKNNTKRGADTEVLMNEIHDREAGSDAHVMAFARMKYIHSRYRKAGKILDEICCILLALRWLICSDR